MKFIYLESLQIEMQGFLKEYCLPEELLVQKEFWLNFIVLLV